MQSATDFEIEREWAGTGPLKGEALFQDFLEFEDIKLSSILPRGTVLFAEGQRADGVYLVCTGRAKVSISSSEAKTVILRIAQPGDLLGINSVLKGVPYDATVETIERCRFDFVSCSDFLKLLDKSRAARVRVSLAVCKELTEAVESARSLLLSKSAEEKLARLLLKWCNDLGKPSSKGIRLNHGLTQEEIAQMICASRETVSRLFRELKRKHIVCLNGTFIFVLNRSALELTARL